VKAYDNILPSIGNTSLVQLQGVVPVDCGRIFAKLEWQNPTGSMKDRMALSVISRAEEDGRLSPGGTVVEYTGGSTGASLALVCAAKEYRIHVVSSRAFSQEKLDHMVAYGAQLTLVSTDSGGFTKQLFLDMIEAARQLALKPNTLFVNQLSNTDAIAGYYSLGEEIWTQTNGEIDAFVHSVGTGASLRGVATVLKRYNPKIKIIAVEPEESCVLSGGRPGTHDIEGIGIGYTPPLWDPNLVDEVLSVKTAYAKEMARRLAQKEGIFAGTSSGGNVHAAIRIAKKLGPASKIVTLMVDSGLKYLSTDLYRTNSPPHN
jgi:cysteine synthase A